MKWIASLATAETPNVEHPTPKEEKTRTKDTDSSGELGNDA